jgi:hypothetical protein
LSERLEGVAPMATAEVLDVSLDHVISAGRVSFSLDSRSSLSVRRFR